MQTTSDFPYKIIIVRAQITKGITDDTENPDPHRDDVQRRCGLWGGLHWLTVLRETSRALWAFWPVERPELRRVHGFETRYLSIICCRDEGSNDCDYNAYTTILHGSAHHLEGNAAAISLQIAGHGKRTG